MYYHVHKFNIMEFKNIRSVWNGRSNGNGIAILQWPTYCSSRLLQICHHLLLYNKYCVLEYGTMYYHGHIFNIMEIKKKHPVSMEWPVKWEWKTHSIMIGLWSSWLLQICHHFLVYNKYCVLKYGTRYYHVHKFNIMEFKNIRLVWNGRWNGNGRPIL